MMIANHELNQIKSEKNKRIQVDGQLQIDPASRPGRSVNK